MLFSYLLNCKFAQILNEYNETTITFYAATATVSLKQKRPDPLNSLLYTGGYVISLEPKAAGRETKQRGEGVEKKTKQQNETKQK